MGECLTAKGVFTGWIQRLYPYLFMSGPNVFTSRLGPIEYWLGWVPKQGRQIQVILLVGQRIGRIEVVEGGGLCGVWVGIELWGVVSQR